MKDRIISLITERKKCFFTIRSVPNINFLVNVVTQHPMAHLQLILICLILTNQVPDQFWRLKVSALITNLGAILRSLSQTTIAKKISAGDFSFETHLLRLTNIEVLQLDDLFAPRSANLKISSKDTISGEISEVLLEVLDETKFAGQRGLSHLFSAMKCVYDSLKSLRGKPKFRQLRLAKQQIREMERGLRYLDFIVN